VAKPNYQYEKRQRELAKKRKKEDKEQRKGSPGGADGSDGPSDAPQQATSPDAGPPQKAD
jgi:hypothetical protein